MQAKLHDFGQLVDALGAVSLIETRGVFEQVDHFHLVVVEDLRGQVTDIFTDFFPVSDAIQAKDCSHAASGKHKPEQRADSRGLARSIWPDKAKNLPLFYAKA